jgi:flagellar basal body-associated protein FliL
MASAEAKPENEAVEQDGPEKKGMMGKLIVVAIIGAIVLVETVAATMLLPDPESIAEEIRQEIRARAMAEGVGEEDILGMEDTGPVVEVELGTFDVSIHQHVSNTTLVVNVKVMATVAESEKSTFDSLLAAKNNRLRERILIELRSADVTELTDPGLGLIKRRILEKSNRLFEQPIIKEIIFSNYAFYQQ